MSELSATLIDVGWGDSIFLESTNSKGKKSYAIIDSNDTKNMRSTAIYLQRYFDKHKIDVKSGKPVFDFVMLTHFHADHGQGLKALVMDYGAKYFWYPKSNKIGPLADLIKYCNKYVKSNEAVNSGKKLPAFGDVAMEILWPHYNTIDDADENNNSIVLLMKLKNHSFVLTGDAGNPAWDDISGNIPKDTKFFKIPHHGSKHNAFQDAKAQTPSEWFAKCPKDAEFGISCHVQKHVHVFPDPEVVDLLESKKRTVYRTDEHFHVTVNTDGKDIAVKYSHI